MPYAIAIYQVRLRPTSGRWAVSERFRILGRFSPTWHPAYVPERASNEPPWQPAGTLVVSAGMSWWDQGHKPGAPAFFQEWSAELRAAIRGESSPEFIKRITALRQRDTEWLTPLPWPGGAVVFSWKVTYRTSTSPFPWQAVYLSMIGGHLSRRLQICQHCDVRPCLARDRWNIKCPICAHRTRPIKDYPEVRRVLDRIKKRGDANGEYEQAVKHWKQGLPLDQWLARYGHRRGTQGRKPKRSERAKR
jgi:hypothetical protein